MKKALYAMIVILTEQRAATTQASSWPSCSCDGKMQSSVAGGNVVLYRPEEIRDSDIGTKAGLFEVQKIGDEFYTFIVDCEDPKACTILLRGASKDVLNEVLLSLAFSLKVSEHVLHLDNLQIPQTVLWASSRSGAALF